MDVPCRKAALGTRGCQCCWLWVVFILNIIFILVISGGTWTKKWYEMHEDEKIPYVCDFRAGASISGTISTVGGKIRCVGGTSNKCFIAVDSDVKWKSARDDCYLAYTGSWGSTSPRIATISSAIEDETALTLCTDIGARACHIGLYLPSGLSGENNFRWVSGAPVVYKNFDPDVKDVGDKEEHDSVALVTKKGHDEFKGWLIIVLVVWDVFVMIFIIIAGVLCFAHNQGMKQKDKCCIGCALGGDITLVVLFVIFTVLSIRSGPWSIIASLLALILFIVGMCFSCNHCCTIDNLARTHHAVEAVPVGQPVAVEVIGGPATNVEVIGGNGKEW